MREQWGEAGSEHGFTVDTYEKLTWLVAGGKIFDLGRSRSLAEYEASMPFPSDEEDEI